MVGFSNGLDAQFRDMSLLGDAARDPAKSAELRDKYGASLVGPTLGAKLGLV